MMMKKHLLFSLAIFAVCAAPTNATSANKEETTTKQAVSNTLAKMKEGLDVSEVATLLNQRMSKSKASGSRVALKADAEIAASATGNTYDFLLGPDGSQWYYTQTFEESNYYYTSSTITFYDNTHTQVGTITIDLSEIEHVNQVAVSTDITNSFFDMDESTNEIVLWYHTAYYGVTTTITQVYRIETGELLFEYNGSSILVTTDSESPDSYKRLMLISDSTYTDEETEETTELYVVTIVRPVEWNEEEPAMEYQFVFDSDRTTYMGGSYINFWVVDNEPYFITAQYDEQYAQIDYDYSAGTYDLDIAEDNPFVVTIYDADYNEVGRLTAEIETPDDAYMRMASFGMMSDYDLSKNYFTDDGDFAYVITWYDYITSEDDYRYQFDVYNADGEYVNTVCDNVFSEYYMLAPVKGQEDQMMFMQIIDDVEQIQTVDIPSCTYVTTIPAEIEGEEITTEMNRYQKDGGNQYQYLIKLAYATSDDDGNVIARLGWYDTDLTLDHYASFNLGEDGENFRPGLYDNMMNPYLFNTNDSMEYVYFAKIMNDSTSSIDDYLVVEDENGNTYLSIGPDDEKGSLSSAYLLTEGEDQAELAVVYVDDSYDNYTVDFYDLPFEWFSAGGDGTAENPYLIATAGDLVQVRTNTEAYYKVIADIDMDSYPYTWAPISTFSGEIDGDSNCVSNLYISSDDYYTGIFGYLENGSSVKNLILVSPTVEIVEGNAYAGIIAGDGMGATLSNIHIYDGSIVDASDSIEMTAVGGLMGSSTLYGSFESCSYEGDITSAGCTGMGGIVGDIRTATTVNNAYAEGAFVSGKRLGGIVGKAYSSSDVTNSHANVSLTAGNTVGGIVGYNYGRVLVEKCHAEGTIEANTQPTWGGMSVGGIVGDLETDWSQQSSSDVDAVISKCVADIDITVTNAAESDSTVHRIVGMSMINEDWEEDETPVSEKGLADNYAVSTMTVNGSTIDSDDATSTEGASIAEDELTEAFFADTLGYAFGEDTDNPWKGESGMPILYYEDVAAALLISDEAITLAPEETYDITVSVYGTDASNINLTCSDEDIAQIEISDEGDGYVTVTVYGVSEGEAVLTATAGTLTVECEITVSETTGINNAVVNGSDMTIKLNGSDIEAAGAQRIDVYSVSGQQVASAASSSISATSIASGVYIVVAYDDQGNKASSKIVIK